MNAVERLLAHAEQVVSLFDSLLDRQGIQGDVVAAQALYQAVEQHASAAALWQSVAAMGFAVEQTLSQAAERGEQHGPDCDLASRAVAKYGEVIAGRNELLAAEVIRGLHARVVAESLSWWPLTDRVVSLSETLCDALDRIRDSPRRVQEVAFPSGLKVNIGYGGPVRDRASWLGEKKTFLAPAMLALRPYANPPAPAGSTSEKQTSTAKQKKRRDRKGIGGPKFKYSDKLVREVVAARKRDEKHAAKSRRPLPNIAEWLSDYFTNVAKLPLSTLPSKDPKKTEEWSIRAKRFWKAANTRLKRARN
jgi:hypothetical protein